MAKIRDRDRTPAGFILPPAFDQLYAVVLRGSSWASRVLWSPPHRAWLDTSYNGHGFRPEPGVEPHTPLGDDLVAAVALVEAVANSRRGQYWTWCGRGSGSYCGISDPGQHLIAPGVDGQPRLYCVQRPDPTVLVTGGDRLHWTWGCRVGEEAVPYTDSANANEVRDRDWCSMCVGSMSNQRDYDDALLVGYALPVGDDQSYHGYLREAKRELRNQRDDVRLAARRAARQEGS